MSAFLSFIIFWKFKTKTGKQIYFQFASNLQPLVCRLAVFLSRLFSLPSFPPLASLISGYETPPPFLFFFKYFLNIFFHLDYVLFCYTLSNIFLPLSVSRPLSIFPYSAFLLFTLTSCLFSSSNHIISSYLCYFQIFPFQTTIPDEGLSLKRCNFNFFF